MNIVYWHNIWLLLVLPLGIIAFQIHSSHQRSKAISTMGDLSVLSGSINQSPKRMKLKQILFVLAIVFLVLAALRPQWGLRKEQVERKGLDIVIALDVSASMFAEDIHPMRLEKSVLEVKRLISKLSGDRVGLVTFSGSATQVCPLTLDYGTLDMFLRAVLNHREAVAGTNISQAYNTAKDLFDFKSPQDKLIILFTDGEDHEGNISNIRSDSRDSGIIIVPVAVGSGGGQPVPDISNDGIRQGYKKDRQGNIVISHVDIESLKQIASVGPYVLDSSAKSLTTLLDDLKNYKRGKLSETRISIHQERYYYFLLMGLILLVCSYAVKDNENA